MQMHQNTGKIMKTFRTMSFLKSMEEGGGRKVLSFNCKVRCFPLQLVFELQCDCHSGSFAYRVKTLGCCLIESCSLTWTFCKQVRNHSILDGKLILKTKYMIKSKKECPWKWLRPADLHALSRYNEDLVIGQLQSELDYWSWCRHCCCSTIRSSRHSFRCSGMIISASMDINTEIANKISLIPFRKIHV